MHDFLTKKPCICVSDVYDCNALTDVICMNQVRDSNGPSVLYLCTYTFLAPSTSHKTNSGWVNR